MHLSRATRHPASRKGRHLSPETLLVAPLRTRRSWFPSFSSTLSPSPAAFPRSLCARACPVGLLLHALTSSRSCSLPVLALSLLSSPAFRSFVTPTRIARHGSTVRPRATRARSALSPSRPSSRPTPAPFSRETCTNPAFSRPARLVFVPRRMALRHLHRTGGVPAHAAQRVAAPGRALARRAPPRLARAAVLLLDAGRHAARAGDGADR